MEPQSNIKMLSIIKLMDNSILLYIKICQYQITKENNPFLVTKQIMQTT